MRIEPNRTGYQGFNCVGIPYHIPGPPDCGTNTYAKLPALVEGAVGTGPYENLSAVNYNTRLTDIKGRCGVIFDPFNGTPIDMYQVFIDEHLAGYLEDECYTSASEQYSLGFAGPIVAAQEEACITENKPHEGGDVFPCPGDPNQPTVFLTVTGDEIQTINWCGETWHLPYDSGTRISVCPTAYIYQLRERVLSTGRHALTNEERWERRNAGGEHSALRLEFRQKRLEENGVPVVRESASHLIRLVMSGGTTLEDHVLYQHYFTAPNQLHVTCELHVDCSKPAINFFKYNIKKKQFGSYEDTEAKVTYKWEQGSGW